MNRPKAIAAIVVTRIGRGLHIYPANKDADKWVKKELPSFGEFNRRRGPGYHLEVNGAYDVSEIHNYILSYNK